MKADAQAKVQDCGVTQADADWFRKALMAGVYRVFERREHINRINVFPVADADTGTNLAFTLRSILAGIRDRDYQGVGALMDDVAELAIDGARGNSGAIFAQYLQGFAEAVDGIAELTASRYAQAALAGAQAAGSAIAEPREGTMLTVIRDYAEELGARAAEGVADLCELMRRGLERARASLAATPEKLEVLRRNNVVDAGGQGFVELLEGMLHFAHSGELLGQDVALGEDEEVGIEVYGETSPPEHRFCTECVVTGEAIDRNALRDTLLALDASSLVLAGTKRKVRVHVHVDSPGKVFLACEDFGAVTSQKADDMRQQSEDARQEARHVAIVVDTGADIPEEEVERLGIHLVPLRINFGDRQFLDKVSLTPEAFYARFREEDVAPRTSQPPPGDFRRQFEFLQSHYEGVLCVNISGSLSGTWQNAQLAARRSANDDKVVAFDSRNASTGQALLAMYAAEAAAERLPLKDILRLLHAMGPRTRTYAIIPDLSHGVRGGRIKGWVQKLAEFFRLTVIVGNKPDGTIGPAGAILGRKGLSERFARWLIRRLDRNAHYRIVVAHCDANDGARRIRTLMVEALGGIGSIHKTEAGTALGAHAGPGTMIVGIQEYVPPRQLLAKLEAGDD